MNECRSYEIILSVDLRTYRLKQEAIKNQIPKPRSICWNCRQARFGCFCEEVKAFDSKIHFVILIHPIEVKRRIATGRMAHLCLKNSELIEGEDYSNHARINAIIADDRHQCVVLYPGVNSLNLSKLSFADRGDVIDERTPGL